MTAELLGTVTTPSGALVIGDMGAFELWSGDRPPVAPDWLVQESPMWATAADWVFVGPDAGRAAERYGRQALTYLYEIPGEFDVPAHVAQVLGEQNLDFTVEREATRIPHRVRAERAAAAGGAEFIVYGMPFVAVGGLPADGEFRVYAPPHPSEPGRLESIQLVVDANGKPSGWRTVGFVGVDWGRLAFIDADALGKWVHNESLDGLADLAYWGRDADAVREAFGGEPLPEGPTAFGWMNRPIPEVEEKANAVAAWKREHEAKFAMDFRPHSHHYQVMEQVRRTQPGSGGVSVGGAKMLGFMTSWGDGAFDVEVAEDAHGRLLAVHLPLNRLAQG